MSNNSQAGSERKIAGPGDATSQQAPTGPTVYTRDGFTGDASLFQATGYAPEYLSVTGPHVPRRMVLSDFSPDDESDIDALPSLIADSNGGVRIRASGRRGSASFVIRNVEAEELHFIQEGEVKFETDAGSFVAVEGDFVCLPRSTAYRFYGLSETMRSLIVESRSKFKFVTPYQVGVINYARDMEYPVVEQTFELGTTKLLLRAWDGEDTVFTIPFNPLAIRQRVGGTIPVWKLNIDKIQKVTSLPAGGPPYPFLSTEDGAILFFNMGDRPTGTYRPPIHLNADFDEILHYVRGPAAWGGCDRAGTLTWIPKGVIHQGVAPWTPEPYTSWLLETRATLRWTEQAVAQSELMETGCYGPQVAADNPA